MSRTSNDAPSLRDMADAILNGVLKMLLMVVFICILTPAGFLMRLLGRDFLKRQIRPDVESYWEDVNDQGPPAS